ncbi:dienelactone hydrolase family protein [Nocardia sp. alder85J]|uniref:dienelactone hydrolase family protein n=1 Tax=Nocardia sp. alder85J TaxID=2862949 RepID=UPI001CD57807|nr:dienelactone hydrolase family protein [Nocardia sp. alder85J]MCX4090885.1 dienelactone hydrolase family protein [Nocardia sp. alder85J]
MTEFAAVPLHHDGADLIGGLAVPDGPGPHPGVLVVHTALGPTDMMRERAARLARLGYAALVVDMYGGGRSYPVAEEAGAPFVALLAKPERLRERMVAWHDTLAARPEVDADRTAAIGFCFGGRCTLELARSGAEVKAVVSYHGLLSTEQPAEPGAVRAHVAVYAGALDPFAPRADIDRLESELSTAGADYTLTVFQRAAHGFTDPDADAMGRDGISYNAEADALSWAATVALLETALAR